MRPINKGFNFNTEEDPVPQRGDKVKISYEGEYFRLTPTFHEVVQEQAYFTAPTDATITVLVAYVAPEPPYRSVVMDNDGYAWQLQSDGLWRRWGAVGPMSWNALNEEFGPIHPLFTAKEY